MSTSIRLTLEQRLEIMRRVKEGETRVALAAEFGVHEKTIRRIISAVESRQNEHSTGIRRGKIALVDAGVPNASKTPARGHQSPNARYGDRTVTREGSYIQRNADGDMVRVLSCPVYNGRQRCIGRYDVEIISMQGKNNGTGSFRRHSGETVMGRLNFSFDGGMASRIEFRID